MPVCRRPGIEKVRIDSSGNVGIGTTSPGYRFQVGETSNYGWVNTNGSWGTDSDRRLKTNIETINNSLDIVQALEGVRFNKIDDSEGTPKQIGFIAQDVEVVLPEVVSTNDEGGKGLAYSHFTPVLVNAIKELKQENNELKSRIEALELRLER